ncbi:nucleotidyl transferase AbiEii/AbiGii toxin family protein [Pelagerythrobacter aerophilus]|uniref:Nucleotidyl transferase AbiEii/AbiGii toxin family protein n=1 Tax=Pelagerythrobacter aerophilus TaxID=2306995 RepID=A0A418NL79_9SPHN|nr:nucleotidyl transferase AbiEii/AbiGii toxin family protein [Pelagerythrobacter aerophilus]RIV80532.1 hypothetical protein D2V04_02170 [Pelagerythrobacter aerophilus]
MAFQDAYRQQVALLIRTIPFVAQEQCFALKGGTAINLFVRDLPRLSVDIDLTYLPVEDRASSLKAIDAAMVRMRERIESRISDTQPSADGEVEKLFAEIFTEPCLLHRFPTVTGTISLWRGYKKGIAQ